MSDDTDARHKAFLGHERGFTLGASYSDFNAGWDAALAHMNKPRQEMVEVLKGILLIAHEAMLRTSISVLIKKLEAQ